MSNAKSQALKKFIAGGKKYSLHKDALGHVLVGRDRDSKIPGYRTMSGASRYNHKLTRTFANAAEDKADPIIKSFHRKHRNERRKEGN